MARFSISLGAVALLANLAGYASAQATAAPYGQCGGNGYSGPTLCPSGWSCSVINEWYHQCLQGASTPVTTTTKATTTTPITTTGTITTTTKTTTSAPGPTTLLPNYLWIRAVTTPNFHKYLQSSSSLSTGDAILGPTTKAAQFAITSGQLTHYLPGGGFLYGRVEARADATVNKLKLSWATTPATSGTFAWSGDALTWTIPGITRQNNAAWLACGATGSNMVLYVNLGAYGYQTPAGCYDHTIHFYNGATADA